VRYVTMVLVSLKIAGRESAILKQILVLTV